MYSTDSNEAEIQWKYHWIGPTIWKINEAWGDTLKEEYFLNANILGTIKSVKSLSFLWNNYLSAFAT